MWSYYGSKSKIVDLYPPPKHSKIIEPFAGSARYSLKYFDRDVLLVDAYEVVVKIWHYLQRCSPTDILSLPKFEAGMDLRKCNLSDEERLFLGMCAGIASTSPRHKVSMYASESNGRKNRFKLISEQLYKIKHWKIECKSFEEIPNQDATWFIDPPYQFGGNAYVKSNKNINFKHLADWCKTRQGQTIVCENTKANWLPFRPIKTIQGAGQTFTTEAIYSNHITNFDTEQTKLF